MLRDVLQSLTLRRSAGGLLGLDLGLAMLLKVLALIGLSHLRKRILQFAKTQPNL